MEKPHQVRIKNWLPRRHKMEERTIKHCAIKQRNSIEKEMNNINEQYF